jgi:LAO/AO transport system kinase
MDRMTNLNDLLERMIDGDVRSLAKLLTAVENDVDGMDAVLKRLKMDIPTPVIGITGPPGAGKSSLVNALLEVWTKDLGLKVAVLAIDPSSPFNLGALLGDRLRMADHFLNDKVFIRSMASRGALGGLAHKVIEAVDVLKNAGFDRIVVETVGVGQSEIEIAGLADTTVLVLVPESGDDVQAIKSGIMEIGDVFVVNKADRHGADTFYKNILNALHQRKPSKWNPPVMKTISTRNIGITELIQQLDLHANQYEVNPKKIRLMTEKAWKLIAEKRMKNVHKSDLQDRILKQMKNQNFNLYSFVSQYDYNNKQT